MWRKANTASNNTLWVESIHWHKICPIWRMSNHFFPDFMNFAPSYISLSFDRKDPRMAWILVLWDVVFVEIGLSRCSFNSVAIFKTVLSLPAHECWPSNTIPLCWCHQSIFDIPCHDLWHSFPWIIPFNNFPFSVIDAPWNRSSIVWHLWDSLKLISMEAHSHKQSTLYTSVTGISTFSALTWPDLFAD